MLDGTEDAAEMASVTEDSDTAGGMTASSGGAPFSTQGTSPGGVQSENPSGMTAGQLQESAAHDQPLPHDALGEGLVSALAAGPAGIAEAAESGAEALAKAAVDTVAHFVEGVGHSTIEDELHHEQHPETTVQEAAQKSEAPTQHDETPAQHADEMQVFEDGTTSVQHDEMPGQRITSVQQ